MQQPMPNQPEAQGQDPKAQVSDIINSVNDGLTLVGELIGKMGAPEAVMKQMMQAKELYQSAVSELMGGSPSQGPSQQAPEVGGSKTAAPESMQRM